MDRRLVILFFTIFIDLIGFGIFVPVVPIYARELNASEALVGDTGALFSLMMFIFTPFWGSLSDRYGRRPAIMAALAISALSYVMFAHATTLLVLILSRMLTGVGSGNITAAQAYITDITPPAQRAKSMGLIGAAFGMGFIFGPPLGSIVFDHWGIMWVGYFAAILCALNLVAVWWLLPESHTDRPVAARLRIRPVTGALRGLRDVRFRDLYLIGFIYITAFSMMQMTIAMLWYDDYDLNKTEIGYMFTLIGVSSAVVQGFMIGLLQRIFGRHLLGWGVALVTIGLVMFPFIPQGSWFLPITTVAVVLQAVGNACLSPTWLARLSANAGTHEQGEVLGTNQSFGSLARIVGPALGGRFYGWNHALPYVGAGMIMLGALYYVYTYQRRDQLAERV